MYEIANTIGNPPIAPAVLAPANLAINKIIAVTTAETRLFQIISMFVFTDRMLSLPDKLIQTIFPIRYQQPFVFLFLHFF